jgi:hypothetical protein
MTTSSNGIDGSGISDDGRGNSELMFIFKQTGLKPSPLGELLD